MNYFRVLLAAGLICGASELAIAADAHFEVTDKPGYWFDTHNKIAETQSLAIIAQGETVYFTQPYVESLHTVTSLIWPTDATADELIDQPKANKDPHHVKLTTPGLYVFVCKLHPYMLAGVIVDSTATPGLDIGKSITLAGVGPMPSYSNLGLRLLRAFFVVTSPANWKDYNKAGQVYQPVYPDVPVSVADEGGNVIEAPSLRDAIIGANFDGGIIEAQKKPLVKGVGEVWVDTQYELTAVKGESFPGTISVVEVDSLFPAHNWKVKRKIALPHQKMNNGHNMWASQDQRQIYQTEWHGKSLFILDRWSGKLLREIEVGDDPAHVMTRVDNGDVHVSLNGADGVAEGKRVPAPYYLRFDRVISMQDPSKPTDPTQPHAHWMGYDGKTMATPNANVGDSTLYDFVKDEVASKLKVGALPIAVGMMPDSSKYYVSNYLSHSLTVIDMKEKKELKTISLIEGYDAVTGLCGPRGTQAPCKNIGALPIQTPVSPDGKFVITGNTLTGTITIVDTKTDKVVKTITCDPGCHGVNFGAKKGGGYYAYVTSKFANRLIVLDYDPNRDGDASDAVIAGGVVLANDNVPKDDQITGNRGMGGQGVLPVPNVYNGWVQKLPIIWKIQLTHAQRHPFPSAENHDKHDDDRD